MMTEPKAWFTLICAIVIGTAVYFAACRIIDWWLR